MSTRFDAFLYTANRTSRAVASIMFLILVSCVSTDTPTKEVEVPRKSSVRSFDAGVSIAIFDFAVRSSAPGYEALSVDVPAALAEAFISGGIVRPLERAALEKVIGELELSMSGFVDPATAAKVGKLAGARFALLGTTAVVGGQIRLSCRVVDVETAEIVYAKSAYGDVKDIFKIEQELAELIEKDFSS